MRRLYFHARGHRFQITREVTEVMHKDVWVMEQAGKHSMGSGLHAARHCRTAPPTVEGLAGLLAQATTERIW